MPMADDNDAVIKERLFLDKADPKILHDEITTMDNSVTRPWSVLKSYRRDKEVIWVEDTCTEANPYVTIARQTYFLSADGKLMPVKKNQPPPDSEILQSSQEMMPDCRRGSADGARSRNPCGENVLLSGRKLGFASCLTTR